MNINNVKFVTVIPVLIHNYQNIDLSNYQSLIKCYLTTSAKGQDYKEPKLEKQIHHLQGSHGSKKHTLRTKYSC